MELSCSVQTYAWGKVGSSSEVARLAAGKACREFTLEEETNYAELWMGIHPNGPARLVQEDQLLAEYIEQNPDCLGRKTQERFGATLPFLFKVLSVKKALSIQAHPNKSHAEQLHAERPNIYKDPNHKPEIAVALTQFEGLCGFRPLAEIQTFLQSVPELRAAVTEHQSLLAATQQSYDLQLREAFQSLMVCSPEVLKEQLEALQSRLAAESRTDPVSALFQRLHSQYPGDVGCFVIYFLNHLQLSPGEAMFLGPNVPHAYLSGDCVEVMANSDNVVRAGLTPKLIDVPTLVSMLDYTCTSPATRKFSADPDLSSSVCLEFDPPVPDFSVARYQVPGEKNDYQLAVRDSASIVLVIEGSGKYLASKQITRKGGLSVVEPFASDNLSPGSVLFLPADKILEVFPEDCSHLVLFQAYCRIHKFGATLTSWTVEGQEMIFVSPKAVMDGSKAIRGGIPICWPAFGPWSQGSQHGFARSSVWSVSSSSETERQRVTLTLSESPAWDQKFLLTYTVTLGETSLDIELSAKNCNTEQSIDFTTALHTYFRVDDVEKASISGLKGLSYLDKTLAGAPTCREEREEVGLSGWTDRVYLNSPDTHTIHGVPGGKMVLRKTNLADTVVWNPWEEKAGQMADLGGENWRGFLCVEAGQCVEPVSLGPGREWRGSHNIQYCRLPVLQ